MGFLPVLLLYAVGIVLAHVAVTRLPWDRLFAEPDSSVALVVRILVAIAVFLITLQVGGALLRGTGPPGGL